MSTDQLRQALRDVDFPAGKDELIRAAQASGAPGEVIRALRAIPPEEYANREEVARSVPKDPAEELGPAGPAGRAGARAPTAGSTCRSTCGRCPSPRWKTSWTTRAEDAQA